MSLTTPHESHLMTAVVAPVKNVFECCQNAKKLEDKGEYEAARKAMGSFWERVGESPRLDGLTEMEAAHVLLRASSLTRWLGSSYQVPHSMEIAKNLATRSVEIFTRLDQRPETIESYTNLASFYLREGAYDESRANIQAALSYADGIGGEAHAFACIVGSQIEIRTGRFQDALHYLNQIKDFVGGSQNHLLKSGYHNNLAPVYKNLGRMDDALIEYKTACGHLKEAGHLPHYARAENNLGLTFLTLGLPAKAHEHLSIARSVFSRLGDKSSVAQVDETRARAYLAEGKHKEAAKTALESLRKLKEGGEYSFIVEAKITYATALARFGKQDLAWAELQNAFEIATHAGDREGAGLSCLVMLEEVSCLDGSQRYETFIQADSLLDKSQDAGLLSRLRTCARIMVSERVNKKDLAISLGPGFSLSDTLISLEISLIEEALTKAGGNVAKAADLLGLKRQNLEWKIERQYKDRVNFSRKEKRKRSIVKQELAKVIPMACYRPDLAASENCLCVRLTDDSLKRLGPREGDVLTIQKGEVHEEDPVTLHTKAGLYVVGFYYKKNGKIVLESDDPEFEAFVFEESEVEIDGKIIGYFKQGDKNTVYPLLAEQRK